MVGFLGSLSLIFICFLYEHLASHGLTHGSILQLFLQLADDFSCWVSACFSSMALLVADAAPMTLLIFSSARLFANAHGLKMPHL